MRRIPAVLLIAASVAIAADPPSPRTEAPAEKLGKALQARHELEIDAAGLDRIAQQLSSQTGVPFAVDQGIVSTPAPGIVLPGYPGDAVVIKLRGTHQLGDALHKALMPYDLCTVVVGDRIYLTTRERAVTYQMRQRVTVQADGEALRVVLERLARQTGVNIVVDPEMKKEAEAPVTIKLNDTPLEVAVLVLASTSGAQAIRLDRVLLVTSTVKVERLRPDVQRLEPPQYFNPYGLGWNGIPSIGLIGAGQLGQPMVPGGQFAVLGGFGVMGGGPIRRVGTGVGTGVQPPGGFQQPMLPDRPMDDPARRER